MKNNLWYEKWQKLKNVYFPGSGGPNGTWEETCITMHLFVFANYIFALNLIIVIIIQELILLINFHIFKFSYFKRILLEDFSDCGNNVSNISWGGCMTEGWKILRTCDLPTKNQNCQDLWFCWLRFTKFCHTQIIFRTFPGQFQIFLWNAMENKYSICSMPTFVKGLSLCWTSW